MNGYALKEGSMQGVSSALLAVEGQNLVPLGSGLTLGDPTSYYDKIYVNTVIGGAASSTAIPNSLTFGSTQTASTGAQFALTASAITAGTRNMTFLSCNPSSVGNSAVVRDASAGIAVGAIAASGIVTVTNATGSSASTNGAVVVTGGVGIGGVLNVGGALVTGGSISSSNGVSAVGQINGSSTAAADGTAGVGAIITAGGAMIAKPLYLGVNGLAGGGLYLNNATAGYTASLLNHYVEFQYTSATTGSLVTASNTIYLTRIGRVVTMFLPAIFVIPSVTGLATVSTAMPAYFRPAGQVNVPTMVNNSSTDQQGITRVQSDGTITLYGSSAFGSYIASGAVSGQYASPITWQFNL